MASHMLGTYGRVLKITPNLTLKVTLCYFNTCLDLTRCTFVLFTSIGNDCSYTHVHRDVHTSPQDLLNKQMHE